MNTKVKETEAVLTKIQYYIDKQEQKLQLINEVIEYKKGKRSLKEIKKNIKRYYQVQSPLLSMVYLSLISGVFLPIFNYLSVFFLLLVIQDSVLIPIINKRKYLNELRFKDLNYLEEELELEEILLKIYNECLTEAINKYK